MDATVKQRIFDDLESLFKQDSKMIKWVAGAGVLLFGPLAVYYFITEPWDIKNYIILAGFIASLLWLMSGIKKGDLSRNDAYKEIRKENGNIIWIYPEDTQLRGAVSYNLKFQTKEGKIYGIPTAQHFRQAEVIENLIMLYPEAKIGYDKKRRLK